MFRRAGIDESVLAELRGIRAEIQTLSARISDAVPRSELEKYLPRETFAEHMRDHEVTVQGWRFWGPYVLSGLALLLAWMQASGIHLTGR